MYVDFSCSLNSPFTLKGSAMKLMPNKIYLAIATVLFSQSAMAQSQEASSDENQASSLEVIEVTSRKRAESLNKIPVAVSAFTDTVLEQQGLQTLDDIARFAPGLSFSKAFGRSTERPVIRGLSNVLAGVQFGVESGAAYFVDGNYFAGDIQTIDISDIARVEIIKGPQSALFGRNSYSGAVNFITKGPDHEELRGNVRVNLAQHSEHVINGYITAPLNDWLAASLSIRDYKTDGDDNWLNTVTDKLIGGEKTRSYSIVLDATPSDLTSIRLRVQMQDDDDQTRPLFLSPSAENNCFEGYRSLASWPATFSNNANQYYCGAIGNFPIALNDLPDADGEPNALPGIPVNSFLPSGVTFFGNPYDTNDGTPFDGVNRELLYSNLSLNHEFANEYSLHTSIGYRDENTRTGSDSDHSSINFTFFPGGEGFFAISGRSATKDTTAEFNIRSPLGDLQWMVGGFYFKQTIDGFDLSFDDTVTGVYLDESTVENRAIYAFLDYAFNNKLDGTLEARYAEEQKTVTEFNSAGAITFDEKGDWNNFTPRATLNYEYSDDTIFYAIAAKGVKPGGINGSVGRDANFPFYEQEELLSFEVGTKTSAFDNLYATVSAYYNRVTDLQLTTPLNAPTGNLLSVATNQGEGNVLGIEVELFAQFTDNLSGRFNYALADSEFTKGCDDYQWSLTSGGGVLVPGTNSGTDFRADFGITEPASCSIKGNAFPLSSKHQLSAFLEYTTMLKSNIEFFSSVDASYESKKYVQVHNLAYVDGVTLMGARIGVRGESWRLSLFGRNLTDDDTPILATRWLQIPLFNGISLNSAPEGADTGSPRTFFAAARRGRQIGVEFNYQF